MKNRLKFYRQQAELTQKQLADIVGVSEAYVSQIERYKRNVNQRLLNRFAEVLKCEPSDLLEDGNSTEPEIAALIQRIRQMEPEDRQKVYDFVNMVVRAKLAT